MFNSVERNAMQFPSLDVVFFQFSGLNVFTLIQYTIAMLGYADEDKTTVLELTYNYGVTEYSKGNAYAQVFAIFYQQHFPINILAFLIVWLM